MTEAAAAFLTQMHLSPATTGASSSSHPALLAPPTLDFLALGAMALGVLALSSNLWMRRRAGRTVHAFSHEGRRATGEGASTAATDPEVEVPFLRSITKGAYPPRGVYRPPEAPRGTA